MLALATVGFALTFWAWALLSPLGATLREQLGATSFQQSLLVAVPVIVGSLGRIPVGALTDRLGARRMFPVVALLTVLPVLYLGHFADSLDRLPGRRLLPRLGRHHVRDRHPVRQRLVSPRAARAGAGHLRRRHGRHRDLGVHHRAADQGRSAPASRSTWSLWSSCLRRRRRTCCCATGPTGPSRPGPCSAGSRPRCGWPATWQLSFLYAVAFGGFVAFSVYLPTYLTTAYHLDRADAALRTAGFVVLAVAMRPIGGWLSRPAAPDRRPRRRLRRVAVFAVLAAFQLPLIPVDTIAFLGIAAALGDRHRCGLRPRRPHGRTRTGRGRHRSRRRRRRARWILPAPGHGPGLRRPRQLHPRFLLLAATAAAALFTATVVRRRAAPQPA